MNENVENLQIQDNSEYPDSKPVNGNKGNRKIAVIALGLLVASVALWTAFAGSGSKSKRIAKQTADTVMTPEYEENLQRRPGQVSFHQGGSSLLPEVKSGQDGFDPNAVALNNNLSYSRPEIGNEADNGRKLLRGQLSAVKNGYADDSREYSGSAISGGIPSEIQNRLDAQYQTVVEHFKSTPKFAWSIDDATYEKLKGGDRIHNVEHSLKDLYEGAQNVKNGFEFTISAGTRIIATTDQPVSSDHPGYFTSTIIRPFDLKGAKLVCQAGQNQNDRIPVQPVKVILEDKTELAIQGQVEMGFPGLEGRVKNHWAQRVIPGIVSAAVGGGAAAYLLNSSTPAAGETNAGNISTRDLIAGPILESSVQQAQSEIQRFGKDLPNTVLVRAGQQFSILLTEKLTFSK